MPYWHQTANSYLVMLACVFRNPTFDRDIFDSIQDHIDECSFTEIGQIGVEISCTNYCWCWGEGGIGEGDTTTT